MMNLPTSAQTGRMTAVMRAVRAQPQPKVLRVGMLVEGRIVEERIVKTGDFEVDGATFARTSSGYRLSWASGAKGRIAVGGNIVDLSGAGEIALGEDARGKIVLGKVTLLFQLVEPPPPQARPQLPLAVKAGLPIDWRLTIIAALSFLAHFGLVGAMYSDWTDAPVDTGVDIQGLVDLSRAVAPTVPLEDHTVSEPSHPTTSTNTTSTTSTTSNTAGTHTADPNARAAALARQADAMEMDLLAAFGGESAVDNALRRSNIPPVDLDHAASQNSGVKPGEDLKLATNGGVTIVPGQGDGLSKLGPNGRTNPDGHGTYRDPIGPQTNVDVRPEPLVGVPIHNLEATIAGLRPQFRSCYNKGVLVQPDMEGKITMLVKLAPNGEVASVEKVDGQGLSDSVEQCLMKRVKGASFDAPGGNGSSFKLPAGFYTQKPH